MTITVATIAFGIRVPASAVGPLVAAGVAVAFSSASLGVLAAAFSVRTRDTFTAPNVFELVLTLLCGVFIAPARLPLHLGAASAVLPLRHGVEAALEALAGHGMAWRSRSPPSWRSAWPGVWRAMRSCGGCSLTPGAARPSR